MSDIVAADQIRAFVERIERIEEEVKDLNRDKSEIFAEAKGNGFDVKALKIVIGKRRQDHAERMELEAIVELYEAALGMGYTGRYHDNDEDARPSRARAHVRESWNVDENGDGPTRRMTKARQAIFDTLEVEGIIAGRDTGRCVYFLHAPDAGVLKIGSSDDVMKRVKSLQGSSPVPLVLLGSIGGGLEHELELHGLFADRRVHGEWFTADDEFLTNIRWRIAHGANPSTAVDLDGGSENAPATVDTNQPETANSTQPQGYGGTDDETTVEASASVESGSRGGENVADHDFENSDTAMEVAPRGNRQADAVALGRDVESVPPTNVSNYRPVIAADKHIAHQGVVRA